MGIKNYLKKFLLNPKFRAGKIFRSLDTLTNYSEKERLIKNCISFIHENKIEGDYLEFGVFRGDTFVKVYSYSKLYKLKDINFYAFDSFKGLPQPKSNKEKIFFSEGKYSCTEKDFKLIIKKSGVDLRKVKIIKGFYDKSLNKSLGKRIPLKKASLIFIDCDLYSSTVPVLNFIEDYIQNGTIIIFDDYFCIRGDPNQGERKAFNEWLKKNSKIKATQFYKYGWSGNSFIIHK